MLRDYRLSPTLLAIVAIIYCPETMADIPVTTQSSEKSSQVEKLPQDGGADEYVEFNDQLMMQGGKIDIKRYKALF